jgi:hypothetical protein
VSVVFLHKFRTSGPKGNPTGDFEMSVLDNSEIKVIELTDITCNYLKISGNTTMRMIH